MLGEQLAHAQLLPQAGNPTSHLDASTQIEMTNCELKSVR